MAEKNNFQAAVENLEEVFMESMKKIKSEKEALDDKIKNWPKDEEFSKYHDIISKLEKGLEQMKANHHAQKTALMDKIQHFSSEKSALTDSVTRLTKMEIDLRELLAKHKKEKKKLEERIELLKRNDASNVEISRRDYLMNIFTLIENNLEDLHEMFECDGDSIGVGLYVDSEKDIDTSYVANLDREILCDAYNRHAEEKGHDFIEFLHVFDSIIKLRNTSIYIFCISDEINELEKLKKNMLEEAKAKAKKYDSETTKGKSDAKHNDVEIDTQQEEQQGGVQLAHVIMKCQALREEIQKETDIYRSLVYTMVDDVLNMDGATTFKIEMLKKKLADVKGFAKFIMFQDHMKWATTLMEKLNVDLFWFSKQRESNKTKSPVKDSQHSELIDFIMASSQKVTQFLSTLRETAEIDDPDRDTVELIKYWRQLEKDFRLVITNVAADMMRYKCSVLKGGNMKGPSYGEICEAFSDQCSPTDAEGRETSKSRGAESIDQRIVKVYSQRTILEEACAKISNEQEDIKRTLKEKSAETLMLKETHLKEVDALKKRLQRLKDSKDSEKMNLTKTLESTRSEKEDGVKEVETLKEEIENFKKQQLKIISDNNDKINLKNSIQRLEEEKSILLENISTLKERNETLLSKEDDLKMSLDENNLLLKKVELSEAQLQQEKEKIQDISKRLEEKMLQLKQGEDKIINLTQEKLKMKKEFGEQLCSMETQLRDRQGELTALKLRAPSYFNIYEQFYRDTSENNEKPFNEAKQLILWIQRKIEIILRNDLVCAICRLKVNSAVTGECGHIFCEKCVNFWFIRAIKCHKCDVRVSNVRKSAPIIDNTLLILNDCATKLRSFTDKYNL